MREYPRTLINIIEASGMNLNSISKVSGVSNAYLTKLSKGKINHPGKDKIASILLALNISITIINQTLAEYDYQPLNHHDIPQILENNSKRKIEGRILHQYDHLYFELMLAALESLGGTKQIVKNRPSGIFMPYELYMRKEFPHEADGEAAKFLVEFTGHVVRERKKLFLQNCNDGCPVQTYICKECLAESLERTIGPMAQQVDPHKVELQAQYYANAVSASLKGPDQHPHFVVERCSHFQFQVQDADGDHPKVSYTGNRPHSFNNPYDQLNLEGFSTDGPAIVQLFLAEIEMCRGAIDHSDGLDTPEGFHHNIRAHFARHGVEHLFEHALSTLMNKPDFFFF